jgi:hypothetical protein
MDIEFDKLIEELENQTKPKNINHCCINPDVKQDEENNNICINCGIIEYTYLTYNIDNLYKHKKQYYKRKSYFREKFKLLNGFKLCNNPNYNIMINKLKKNKLIKKTIVILDGKTDVYIKKYFIVNKQIYKIKSLMGSMGYSKLYKYIYNVIYDLYKFRCFKIPVRYLEILTNEWVTFENIYNRIYKKNKNMISYNVIIKLFLEKYNIEYNELLLLPQNKMLVYHKLKKLNYFSL